MRRILIVISIYSLISSCSSNTSSSYQDNIINISLDTIDTIDVNDYFKNIKYVYLETNKESILGEISKIIIFENEIYILDKKGNKGIYVFSIDGKFKYKIAKEGRGVGEYLEPVDFNINSFNKNIYLLDRINNKILIYNLNGEYIGEKVLKVDNRILNFSFIDNDNIVILKERAGNSQDKRWRKLAVYSLEENMILNSYSIPKIHDYGNLKLSNVFFESENRILYWEFFNNTIYSITLDNIVEQYIIDFGKLNIPLDKLKLPISELLSILNDKKEKYAGIIDNIIESDETLYFNFLHNEENYSVLFDKEEKKSRIFLLRDKINKIRIKKIQTVSDNKYVSVIEYYDIDSSSCHRISEIDNPIILITEK